MASGPRVASESHALLARPVLGPSARESCALARPEDCPWAWHEDPGVPREGAAQPGAVGGGGR